MRHSRLVSPTLRSSESVVTTRPDGSSGPLDGSAVVRLRIASVVWGALWLLLGLVNKHLIAPGLALPADSGIPWTPAADALAVLCVTLSAVVFFLAPRLADNPSRLVNVALGFEIVLAFAIAVIDQWEPRVVEGRLSWICVLVIMQPAIVPSPPGKTLAASLIAASMDPLGLYFAHLRGVDLPPLTLLAWACLPTYLCALLAIVPSAVIHRLSRQVSKAREMGSYRLGELIDRGAMGEVWRARHRLLARPAAIKLIRPELLTGFDPDREAATVRRFLREADTAASLQCPHSVQLYDFGVTREREMYLVMELLDGLTLEQLVRRFGPQPAARVAYILEQACSSLAEAHQRGLLHRDVKPANIHLCRLGLEFDFVKVVDFGLAKHIGADRPEQTMVTSPEAVTGTPAYMAPETVAGEAQDGRADLYSLGCVGYYLLTGSLVFPGRTPLQMILMHAQAEPERPSARVGRTLPAGLERLVMACLAKDPCQRPGSAEQLADELRRCGAEDWSQADAHEWWGQYLPGDIVAPPGELTAARPEA
jgi:eukaryotic-like serine/threonine-protein kinase